MLKYVRDEGECSLEMKGNVEELVTEVSYLIRVVHEGLQEKDAGLADAFRRLMIKVISGKGSPVWEDPESQRDILAQKLEELADLLKRNLSRSAEEV